jgi:hypothetical protein
LIAKDRDFSEFCGTASAAVPARFKPKVHGPFNRPYTGVDAPGRHVG